MNKKKLLLGIPTTNDCVVDPFRENKTFEGLKEDAETPPGHERTFLFFFGDVIIE